MDIHNSKNIVTAGIDTTGSVIVGDQNTIINLKEAAQYKELTSQLSELNERFNREKARSIKFPDEEEFKLEILNISKKRNQIKVQIEILKKEVIKLAQDFSSVPIKTERLKIAKTYFEKGEFDKARSVLDAETMISELNALKEEQHDLKEKLALNEQSLKDKSSEFLILARLASIDFTKPRRLETTMKYFEQSISAGSNIQNVLAYINFLKENNQFQIALYLIPELDKILKQEEAKSDLSYLSHKISFYNLNGFLLEQQEKYSAAVDSYTESLALCKSEQKMQKVGSKLLLMQILNNLASLFVKIKQYDQAIYFAKKSGEEYTSANSPDIELKPEYGIALRITAIAYAKIYKIYKTGNKIKYSEDVSQSDKLSSEYFEKSILKFKELSDINPQKYLSEYVICLVEEAKSLKEQLELTKESVAEVERTYRDAIEKCELYSKDNPELFLPVLAKCKVLYAAFLKRGYDAFKQVIENHSEFGEELKDIIIRFKTELKEMSEDAFQITKRLYKSEGRAYLLNLADCQTNLGFAYWTLEEEEKALKYLLQAQQSYETLNKETSNVYLEETIRSTEGVGYLYLKKKDINKTEKALLKLNDELSNLIASNHIEYFNDLIQNLVILSIIFKADSPKKEKSLHYANEALKYINMFDDVPGKWYNESKQRCQEIISYWNKKEGFFARLKHSFS